MTHASFVVSLLAPFKITSRRASPLPVSLTGVHTTICPSNYSVTGETVLATISGGHPGLASAVRTNSGFLGPLCSASAAATTIRLARLRQYRRCRTRIITILILLVIGGVETNPGPTQTARNHPGNEIPQPLIIRSAVQKAALMHDMIDNKNLDLLVLT